MLEGNNNMKSYQTILGMPIGIQWMAYFSQGDTYRDASRPVNQFYLQESRIVIVAVGEVS